ncbi:MAG TPA: hypothetical protein VGM37_18135 [Armatimonadota bacterium]|jgi:mannan endo-1,4-beta-mannosidase
MTGQLRVLAGFLLLSSAAFGQNPEVYDDFSGASLDTGRWELITEAGGAPPSARIVNGAVEVTGNRERAGIATTARLGKRFVVEADALGWAGVNQILQVYGGDGGYVDQFEIGLEGVEKDATPILHIWTPEGEDLSGPVSRHGPLDAAHPLHLRLERTSDDYALFVEGALVKRFTTSAVAGEARIVLYGWGGSVGRWDNIRLSGPAPRLASPARGERVQGPVEVSGAPNGVSSRLEVGRGEYPVRWSPLEPVRGDGEVIAAWRPGPNTLGPVTFRLTARDAKGFERSVWRTVNVTRPALWEPLEGQIVGPAFNAGIGGDVGKAVSARFYLGGRLAGKSYKAPFWARIRPSKDGQVAIVAALVDASGRETLLPPISITVRKGLYGRNARVADDGRAIRFPDGTVAPLIGANEGYTWLGLDALFFRGDTQTARDYITGVRSRGVNVMRIFLETGVPRSALIEDPLGRYAPRAVTFWDRFMAMCERSGMSVILSPWDTFWMNQPWTASPYNAANGGPCRTQRDFITSPAARKWQKARFRWAIDRYGSSSAILAWDLLNEYDIWWNATAAERNAWVDDMAAFVRSYELKKWGRAHMLTVSASRAEPEGQIADTVYRHPMFEFATTHLYYWGAVNDPKNAIDPALSFNHGIRYALSQIRDGRPYTDSESGPIDKWVADESFDNAVHHNESWAHFASGGCGPGMRWPYRGPHILTPGMRQDEQAIAQVSAALEWSRFRPENADARLSVSRPGFIAMGCADASQALIWVAQDTRRGPARLEKGLTLTMAGVRPGRYDVTCWDAAKGIPLKRAVVAPAGGALKIALPPFRPDVAVTLRRR